MQTIAKTFASSDEARRVADMLRTQLGHDRVTLLMPGMSGREIEGAAHTESGEKPGMGAALGGVVGGAVGLSTATLLLPGVGPIIVAGVLAAGAIGAAAGGAAGASLEDHLSKNVPREQLTECLVALRSGRSIALVEVDGDDEKARVRRVLEPDLSPAAPPFD
jgi:hypothetical protein